MVGPQANRSALSRRPAWRSVHELADPRAVWTERIALAPSPTAAATRFIDPDRTTPIAKTSGWLVSNGSGRRPSSAQVAPSNAPSSWVPVSTKPSSSTAMSPKPAGGRGGAYKAEQAPAWLVAVGSVVARRCGVHGDGLKMAAAVQHGSEIGLLRYVACLASRLSSPANWPVPKRATTASAARAVAARTTSTSPESTRIRS